MIFITDQDLKGKVSDNSLQMIIDQDTSILDNAESTAIATVTDFLHARYDVDGMLAKTGSSRDHNLIRWILDLMIYYLYERIPDKLVPERVIKNYDDSLALLLEIADEKKSVKLDRLSPDEDGKGPSNFRWGGNLAKTYE